METARYKVVFCLFPFLLYKSNATSARGYKIKSYAKWIPVMNISPRLIVLLFPTIRILLPQFSQTSPIVNRHFLDASWHLYKTQCTGRRNFMLCPKIWNAQLFWSFFYFTFLGAYTQLHNPLCPSVGPLVHQLLLI